MERSNDLDAKLKSMNGIPVRFRVQPVPKATLPQDFIDKDLTPQQINAFSKESLLKPVL